MKMSNGLKQLLLTYAQFPEEELQSILSLFEPNEIKKNEFLLNEGDIAKDFYYVRSGGIRTYFIDKDGHEKTRYVMLDGEIGTTLASYLAQKPSLEFIQAIEDTELLAINHDNFYHLLETNHNWKEFYIKILEGTYIYQNRKIETLVTLTAKQRYERLLEEKPEYVQRLSNKMLASYLDMREETLSRLKSL